MSAQAVSRRSNSAAVGITGSVSTGGEGGAAGWGAAGWGAAGEGAGAAGAETSGAGSLGALAGVRSPQLETVIATASAAASRLAAGENLIPQA
jgi:hypothetical protein